MAKTKPQLYRQGDQWAVVCPGSRTLLWNSYDEARAEFLRQVELYRQPERKRLLGWVNPTRGQIQMRLEGYGPQTNHLREWQRAPWLDEPEEG